MRRSNAASRRLMPAWTWTIAMLVGGVLAGCGSGAPTTEPKPISANSPFHYPIQLWDQGKEGQTVLMVHVSDMGAVDTAYVQQSSGYAAFDSAALAGVPHLLFAPARKGKNQERVARWVRLPVRFSLNGGPGPEDATAPDSAAADSVPQDSTPPDATPRDATPPDATAGLRSES